MSKLEDKHHMEMKSLVEVAPALSRDDAFLTDILAGLSETPKYIPSIYLYDEQAKNMLTPCHHTYDPAQIESTLLRDNRQEIISRIGSQSTFISTKIFSSLDPEIAIGLLQLLRKTLQRDSGLLIGVDMECENTLLQQVYNDRAGVFALLHNNLLLRINNRLHASFNHEYFNYCAHYNKQKHRVHMQLVSLKRQDVTIAGIPYDFLAGETIQTAYSYKYTQESLNDLFSRAGLISVKNWMDKERLYALSYVIPA